MDEDDEIIPEIHDSVQQRRPEQSVDQTSSVLSNIATDELRTVLTELEALPFPSK